MDGSVGNYAGVCGIRARVCIWGHAVCCCGGEDALVRVSEFDVGQGVGSVRMD